MQQRATAATRCFAVDDAKALQHALFGAGHSGIAVSFSSSVPADFSLTSEEEACAHRFFPKRLQYFVAGRFAASEALRLLGKPRLSIPIGPSREPIWPSSVVGSIAHTEGVAGAIAAFSPQYIGLGLDLERVQPLTDVAPQICTSGELNRFEAGTVPENYLSVLFSAKEAIYKCLWPSVRRFIPFRSVELALDVQDRRFTIVWHDNVSRIAEQVVGYWATRGNLIAAIALAERIGE